MDLESNAHIYARETEMKEWRKMLHFLSEYVNKQVYINFMSNFSKYVLFK